MTGEYDSERHDGDETEAGGAPAPAESAFNTLKPGMRQVRDDAEGEQIEALGHTWTLARLGLAKCLNDQRDRINDDRTLYSDVGLRDIKHAAWLMLSANYRLADHEIVAILNDADNGLLAEAVIAGLMVDEYGEAAQTYTNWARSALLANGIDPARIAPHDIPHVLRQLVATGRAMKLDDFTASGQHHQLRRELMRTE